VARRPDAPLPAEYDVLVVGGCGIDTIVRVDELRVPVGDVLLVPPIRDYVAHSGNGVALGLHALGLRTTFVTFLGDDWLGREIRDKYDAAGLEVAALPAPDGTPRSVNLVDARGQRFSFYDGRHPPDLAVPLDLCAPLLERARHVHLSRSPFTEPLLDEARARGVPISTDLHAWDGVDPSAEPWAFGADVVFMSAASAGERTSDVLARVIAEGHARLAVATDGARGCTVLERGGACARFPALAPERPVVDSNGAGDAFSTAFLLRLLQGQSVEECALAGAVSGAFACTHPGTHEAQLDAPALDAACARARADSRWRPLPA
jgi:sugar/nucleoside kinase (ribokinase family)